MLCIEQAFYFLTSKLLKMSHKNICIAHCQEFLNSISLAHIFSAQDFNHVYRKRNGFQANAFHLGIDAADYIIKNAKTQEVSHD